MSHWIGWGKNLNNGEDTWIMALVMEWYFTIPTVKGVLVDSLKTNFKAHLFHQKIGFVFIADRLLNGIACQDFEHKRTSKRLSTETAILSYFW